METGFCSRQDSFISLCRGIPSSRRSSVPVHHKCSHAFGWDSTQGSTGWRAKGQPTFAAVYVDCLVLEQVDRIMRRKSGTTLLKTR